MVTEEEQDANVKKINVVVVLDEASRHEKCVAR